MKESRKLQLHRQTMRPMEVEGRKAMTGRMMMRVEKREREIRIFGLRRNFQIFIDLVILPGCSQGTGVLSGCRGAPRVQGFLST